LLPPRPPLFPYTTLFRSRRIELPRLLVRPEKHLEQRLRALEQALVGRRRDVVGAAKNQRHHHSSAVAARSQRAVAIRRRLHADEIEEHTSELQSRFDLVC